MEAKVSLYVAANNTWAPGDCPHVYLLACRAAMPLNPPTPQTTTMLKRHFFCCGCRVGGFRGMAALNACIHMCGQSAETNEILDMGAKVHYSYLSSSLCVGCVCYMIE